MLIKHIQFRTLLRSLLGGALIIVLSSSCTSDPNNRPSPLKVDSTKIGDASVSITYSSPGVKERKIFGRGSEYLEKYGEVWRTGANDATFITLDKSIMVDSFLLEEGKYGIFTIPNENKWTVMFNKEWDQWGSYGYNPDEDLFRMDVEVRRVEKLVERMIFSFDGDSLRFSWENSSWAIPLHPLP